MQKMTTYHIIGVLARNDQRQAIDKHLAAGNASAAIESFEVDGYWVMGKVTVLRLPCTDEGAYRRQVALARVETETAMAQVEIEEAMTTMINEPRTKKEALTRRYGVWAGRPKGQRYDPDRCAYQVFKTIGRQCSRHPGHGPDELYCKQHAKVVG